MENKIKQGSTHTFPLPPKNNNKPSFKKWIKYIWTGLAAVVLGIAFLFFAISQGFR
jgi:penicillin-binding protein 1A